MDCSLMHNYGMSTCSNESQSCINALSDFYSEKVILQFGEEGPVDPQPLLTPSGVHLPSLSLVMWSGSGCEVRRTRVLVLCFSRSTLLPEPSSKNTSGRHTRAASCKLLRSTFSCGSINRRSGRTATLVHVIDEQYDNEVEYGQ